MDKLKLAFVFEFEIKRLISIKEFIWELNAPFVRQSPTTELKSFKKIKVNDVQFNFNIVKDPHQSLLLYSIDCCSLLTDHGST